MRKQRTLKQKIIDLLLSAWLVLGVIAWNAYIVGHLAESAWAGWAVFILLGAPWCRWVWRTEEHHWRERRGLK